MSHLAVLRNGHEGDHEQISGLRKSAIRKSLPCSRERGLVYLCVIGRLNKTAGLVEKARCRSIKTSVLELPRICQQSLKIDDTLTDCGLLVEPANIVLGLRREICAFVGNHFGEELGGIWRLQSLKIDDTLTDCGLLVEPANIVLGLRREICAFVGNHFGEELGVIWSQQS